MSALGYLAASIPPRMAVAGSVVAIPILSVHQMNDVGVGGALVAASLGPSVLAAPAAGAALDRARRPSLWIAASGILTAIAFTACAFLGQIPLPVVIVLLVVAGVSSPFFMGGLSSFVANAIPDTRRAFAYDALSYNVSAVAGPAFVAVMATFFPAGVSLGALAVAAVLGAVSVNVIGLEPRQAAPVSPRRAMAAGLQHIFGYRPLAVVTAASTLTQLGQGGLAIAAVALSIDRVGSPSEGAMVVTAFAVGSLFGALLETIRPTRARPHAIMMAGFLATGILTVVAAIDFGITWTTIAIGASGAFTASTSSALLFLRDHLSKPHLKSQIFTVGAGLRTSASAAGAALAASATGLGGAKTLVMIGFVWVMSAAIMAAYPRRGL
jgi:MFS family permease